MESKSLSEFSKEFESEFNQIKFWFSTLNNQLTQFSVLVENLTEEVKCYDLMGRSLIEIVKVHFDEIECYNNEPSQIWKLAFLFGGLIRNIGSIFSESTQNLVESPTQYYYTMQNDIQILCLSISDKTYMIMKELSEFKRNFKLNMSKFTRLRDEMNEAHLTKKKFEVDPKYMYDITVQDKSVAKILELLKEIQKLDPIIKSQTEELNSKKENLNSCMKESFELVINLVIKSNWKIKDSLQTITKEKIEIFTKIYEICVLKLRGIQDLDVNLNDYLERKYAESKDIHFESLDSFVLEDSTDLSFNLIECSDSIIKYSHNFYDCFRIRKKIIKSFLNLAQNFSEVEFESSKSFIRPKENLCLNIKNFILIGNSIKKIWDFYKNVFGINDKIHENFAKVVNDKIIDLLKEVVKEYRNEQFKFKEKWGKFQKNIVSFKSNLVKFQDQDQKIKSNIILCRSAIHRENSSKSENKLKSLLNDENDLKSLINQNNSDYKIYMIDSIDFLKKSTKVLRDLERNKVGIFIQSIVSISKYYEKFIKEYIEFLKIQNNLLNSLDLQTDMKDIFDSYLKSYNISDAYFEKTVKKYIKVFNETLNLDARNSSNQLKILNQRRSIHLNDVQKKKKEEISSKKRNYSENPLMFTRRGNRNENLTFKMESKRAIDIDDERKGQNNISKTVIYKNSNILENSALEPKQLEGEFMESIILSNGNKGVFTYESLENEVNDHSYEASQKNEGSSNLSSARDQKFVNRRETLLMKKNDFDNIKENELKEYIEKLKKNNEDENSPNNKNKIYYDNVFYIDEDEKVLESFSCALEQDLLLQGKLYVTSKKLMFYSWFNSMNFFGKTKMEIPLGDILKVEKRYNLRIFNNSILITTKKRELFFTSFVFRDQCFKLISSLVTIIHKEKKEGDQDEEAQIEALAKEHLESGNHSFSKTKYINNIVKKINFFSRINKITNDRQNLFEEQKILSKTSIYQKTYFDKEDIGNIPLPLIFKNIFDVNSICDELEIKKNFWESLYELRKDYDILKENVSYDVPRFFDDIEYFMSLFTNFEEGNINEMLEDCEKWPISASTFTLKCTHPVKKTTFGPDKVFLIEEFKVCFISPKKLVIEVNTKSSGFKFCDTFYNSVQYLFETNYKYNPSEDCFSFKSTCTILFGLVFTQNCLFKGTIESEGYKESEASIRFNTFEKFKIVFQNQSETFIPQYQKVNEENNQRLASKIISGEIIEDNVDNQENDQVNGEDELNKIENSLKFEIISKPDLVNLYSRKTVYIPYLILFGLFIFKYFSFTDFISIDKILSISTVVLLYLLYYKNNH